VRKGPAAGGAKKTNILGAKKAQKLGAKKIVGDEIDFEEAEKKAREEAERIEQLGYNPDEEAGHAAKTTAKGTDPTTVAAPKPLSPPVLGYGSQKTDTRSSSDVERLGMGMARLGFGQVGKPSAAAAPKKMGFGSMAASKSDDGKFLPTIPDRLLPPPP
jgi:ADP-ribosylation factor GTPase-activating protein 2/3